MTKAELVARAVQLNLGEEAALKTQTNAQLEALLKENDPEYGGANSGDDAPAEKGKATGKGDDPRTGKKKRCRIENSSDADGKFDVFGSVNGYNFHAPRGKEVLLDTGFIDHLRSLTITEFEPVIEGGKATGEHTAIDRPRFNVVVLD